MTKESVNKLYGICSDYLDKLNDKQVNTLYKYMTMRFKEYSFMSDDFGRVSILQVLIHIKCEAKDEDSFENLSIYEKLSDCWTFMLAMLMVQDEYNKSNPNYKSKIKY